MPIDPVTLSILAGVGGSAIKNAPALFKSKFEREQEARLQDLQRKESLGLLGLTDQERATLEGRLSAKSNAAADYAKQERQRLLAAGGGGAIAGSALLDAQALDQQLRQQNQAVSQAIEEQDIAKKKAQTEEIRALEAAQGEYSAQRGAALADIAGSGFEAGISTAAQQKIIQSGKTPSQNSINAVAKLYGLDDEQARGLIELTAQNPEMLNLYRSMQGTK